MGEMTAQAAGLLQTGVAGFFRGAGHKYPEGIVRLLRDLVHGAKNGSRSRLVSALMIVLSL